MYRLAAIALSLVLVASLSSCSLLKKYTGGDGVAGRTFYSTEDRSVNSLFETVLAAIENKDRDAIRSLFSQKALAEADDIEAGIDYLFDLVQGDVVSWKAGAWSSDENFEYGKIRRNVESQFTLTTTEDTYIFRFSDYDKDTIDPDNKGLYAMRVMKAENERTQFSSRQGMRIPGIYIPHFVFTMIVEGYKPDGTQPSKEEIDDTISDLGGRFFDGTSTKEIKVQPLENDRILIVSEQPVDLGEVRRLINTNHLEIVSVADIKDEQIRLALEQGDFVDRNHLLETGELDEAGLTVYPPERLYWPDKFFKDKTKWSPIHLEYGSYTPILTGVNFTDVTVKMEDLESPYCVLTLTFDTEAVKTLEQLNAELGPTNGQIAILLHGYVQAAPIAQDAIQGGQIVITEKYLFEEKDEVEVLYQLAILDPPLNLRIIEITQS